MKKTVIVNITWECPQEGTVIKPYTLEVDPEASDFQIGNEAFKLVAGKQTELPKCKMIEYEVEK